MSETMEDTGYNVRTYFHDRAKEIIHFPRMGERNWGGFSGCVKKETSNQVDLVISGWPARMEARIPFPSVPVLLSSFCL